MGCALLASLVRRAAAGEPPGATFHSRRTGTALLAAPSQGWRSAEWATGARASSGCGLLRAARCSSGVRRSSGVPGAALWAAPGAGGRAGTQGALHPPAPVFGGGRRPPPPARRPRPAHVARANPTPAPPPRPQRIVVATATPCTAVSLRHGLEIPCAHSIEKTKAARVCRRPHAASRQPPAASRRKHCAMSGVPSPSSCSALLVARSCLFPLAARAMSVQLAATRRPCWPQASVASSSPAYREKCRFVRRIVARTRSHVTGMPLQDTWRRRRALDC